MFNKVQRKFFAITTSILLAVFIAVLASINLIMEAIMQRQSQVVLKQIAASVEYDEKTSTFTYLPHIDSGREPASEQAALSAEHKPTGSPADKRNDKFSAAEAPSDIVEENTTENITETASENQPTSTAVTKNDGKNSVAVTTARSTEPDKSSTSVIAAKPVQTTTTRESQITPTAATSAAALTTTQTTVTSVTTTAHSFHKPDVTFPTAPPEYQPPFNPFYPDYTPNPDGGYDYGFKDYPYYPFGYPYYDYYKDRDYDFDYGGRWYQFPMPDYRSDEDCCEDNYKGGDSHYNNRDENFSKDCYSDTEQSDVCNGEASLIQTVGNNTPVLSGYTIINAPRKQAFAGNNYVPVKNDGPVPKSLGSMDFFILMADKNGNFLASLNNENLDSNVAQEYVSAIISDGAANGMLNSFQFCSTAKGNGTIMVFTDKSAEMDMLSQLNRTTILIGLMSFIVLSVIAYFLSKKSIEPVKAAFEKQKQFISDASHELKTPLTIISANADVLSDEIGENKWLDYIKAQAERMNVLVNDLLNLTRLENNSSDFIRCDFDISKAIENTALPFECRAFDENRKFVLDIREGLTVNGSERHIKQMAAIFIDNALKYSDRNGTVKITLTAQGDKKVLSVFNTGNGIKESEKDKIFERFYRSDDSRARATGGYGLGLAIAKSIIDHHKFKLSVNNVEGESICFNIIM